MGILGLSLMEKPTLRRLGVTGFLGIVGVLDSCCRWIPLSPDSMTTGKCRQRGAAGGDEPGMP